MFLGNGQPGARCSRTLVSRARPAARLGPGRLKCLPSCAARRRTPPVRQDAPASCMKYHTNPSSTSTMVPLCPPLHSHSHSLTLTHTLAHSLGQTAGPHEQKTVFPQGKSHMTCNAGCHVTYRST